MSYTYKKKICITLEGITAFTTITKSGNFANAAYAGQGKDMVEELIALRRKTAINTMASLLMPKKLPSGKSGIVDGNRFSMQADNNKQKQINMSIAMAESDMAAIMAATNEGAVVGNSSSMQSESDKQKQRKRCQMVSILTEGSGVVGAMADSKSMDSQSHPIIEELKTKVSILEQRIEELKAKDKLADITELARRDDYERKRKLDHEQDEEREYRRNREREREHEQQEREREQHERDREQHEREREQQERNRENEQEREQYEQRDQVMRTVILEYVHGDEITRLTIEPTLSHLLQHRYSDETARATFIKSLAATKGKQSVEYAGVYALKMQGMPFKYYVGSSQTVMARISQHRRGEGAVCTKGATLIEQLPLVTMGSVESMDDWERAETLTLMYTMGIEHVRGWRFAQRELSDKQKEEIIGSICARNKLCDRCGFGSHMISACYARRRSFWMGGGALV